MVKSKRILVFALCGIGDLVNFTPVIRSLKAANSKNQITVVTKSKAHAAILKHNKDVKKTLMYPSNFLIKVWSRWLVRPHRIQNLCYLLEELKFLRQLKQQKFDVSMWAFPGETKRGAVASFLAGAKLQMGPYYHFFGRKSFLYHCAVDFETQQHSVEDNLSYLPFLGVKKVSRIPTLEVGRKEKRWATFFLRKVKGKTIIGIHPGSDEANPHRRWPIERFGEVISLLGKNKKFRILLFEGPDEIGLTNSIDHPAVLKVKGRSMEEVVALINECNVMITSDSGLGHIANALGKPTITLFGPANPNKTRPYGLRNVVINKLSNQVYEHADLKTLKTKGREALLKITPHEVAATVKTVLQQK